MAKRKRYYKYIDILRLICCLFVLLYHLNILKGGFLAVCAFFVITGYFSCISLFNKKDISLKDYYINRIKKLYLPLVVVVFITIFVVSMLKNILWLNLKPESLSVLLGYNNIWQISANQDYFARHINSPFIHFWYIGILLQFDLVFPFIFIVLKKIGDKSSKAVSILLSCLSIFSTLYFLFISYNHNIIEVYYSTFSRMFSLIYGVTLGFVHHYYKNFIFKWQKKKKDLFLLGYLLIFILLCCLIKSDFKFLSIIMLLVSLISIRLIEFSTLDSNSKNNKFDKVIKYISSISYEVYLVQYPIIFIINEFKFNIILKTIIVIISIFLIAIILNYFLNLTFKKGDFKNKDRKKVIINILKCIGLFTICCFTIFGFYIFLISKDHTNEMKELEKELNNNSKLMEEHKKKYKSKLKDEEDKWLETLNNLEKGEEEIALAISNLSVIGVGDSVMLGAINELYSKFSNGYFDAQISRTDWEANSILLNLKNNNMLGSTIVVGLGSNGACPDECRREIIETCEERDIFWINVTNDYSVNVNWIFNDIANNYSNFHVIDWNGYSAGHPEYFVADGIHLSEIGRVAYTECIYQSIYKFYLDKYNLEKEKIIKEHEQVEKSRYSLYGNDLLLNVYDIIHDDNLPVSYEVDKKFNFKKLVDKLNKDLKNGTLAYNVVFVFNKNFTMSESEVDKLIKLCDGHNVYFISNDSLTISYISKYDFVNIFDLNSVINEYDSYLLEDKIHLNDNGNNELANIIKNNVLKELSYEG